MQSEFIDRFWHRTFKRPYSLRVFDHGGHGPVVILLHGIAASSDKWSELIPLLTPQFHCITIDLLGFGASPKPQWYDYTMEDHLRCLHKTIKRLHLRAPYILIGHSLGSLLASRYVRNYQPRAQRLILLSPPIYPPLTSITSKIAKQRTALFLRIYKLLRHQRITPARFKRLSRLLPLPRSVIRDPQTWTPFMRSLEHCIEQQTIIDDIAVIQLPIDIFYGTLDQIIVPHNIKTTARKNQVTTHSVRSDHDVGKRYALEVAKFITSLPIIE